ncbi:granzyme E-like [Meriones unguiculatus]|uniref:granzyme E-like n=1 Tax=Meriones unguiculatus TaxID=10047 RepID=UPI00293F0FEB|nr:granzyme E-like [Meriones unguiculatus]
MPPVLILLTFLLPLGAGAEEIIGGHEVKPHSRPYMAFIKSVDVNGKKGNCGGFLVRYNFVLTAAHCNGSSMTVLLGAHNIMTREKTQQVIPVEKAIPHRDYNPKARSNDIMLLKLKRKAKRTRAVRPLSLPSRYDRVKPGDVCHLAGWGSNSTKNILLTARLQEVELIVQEDQKCKNRFRHYSKTTEICAGDPKEAKAAFKGDSGGPLVCDNRAYGVLAYGKSKRIISAVFMKVVHFLPWITRNMKLP